MHFIQRLKLENEKYKKGKISFFEGISNFWFDLIRYTSPFCNIRDFYYDVRNRFLKKWYLIDTKLSRTDWHDLDEKLLYGSMALVVDFVEKEDIGMIDWTTSDDHKYAYAKLMEIYHWWKNYPHREKEIEKASSDWFMHTYPNGKVLENLNKHKDEKSIELLEYSYQLEEKLKKEEGEMIKSLVDIRRYLWT